MKKMNSGSFSELFKLKERIQINCFRLNSNFLLLPEFLKTSNKFLINSKIEIFIAFNKQNHGFILFHFNDCYGSSYNFDILFVYSLNKSHFCHTNETFLRIFIDYRCIFFYFYICI